ncbi:hypothetical protein QN277_005679 [Acacia crassicarpa]|uniref:F-box domain-containing protein n=1 Tax=Acacia crassicarpa TaxID=499986 RepID=A0AAE1IYQ5_9FABA|nr:hypothetical protein QN277_005679 [Acacia crassicarpa]
MASTVVKQLLTEDEDELLTFFPNDIIVKILERLPVKSLLRYRCVCKDWNDLFKTSSFIKQHLHHSIRGPSLLLQYSFTFFSDIKQLSLLDSETKTLVPLNGPSIYRHLFLRAYIIGSSYGLLCLQLHSFPGRPLYLWNPATREVQRVPDSINNPGGLCSIGFGFSSVVNDYKIVKIYRLVYSREIRVEIFSLSTGSWKEVVEFGNLESMGFICFKQPFAVTDQAMYFYAYKEDGDQFFCRSIVSFDMAKEVFTLIPVPSPNFLENKELITTYENKLALLSHSELWVMEEEPTSGGSEQRWNREFISSGCSPELHPWTIWRDEAVFIGQRPKIRGANREFFLYLLNLTTRKVKEVLISPEYGQVFCAFNYAESLVSIVNGFEHDPES